MSQIIFIVVGSSLLLGVEREQVYNAFTTRSDAEKDIIALREFDIKHKIPFSTSYEIKERLLFPSRD